MLSHVATNGIQTPDDNSHVRELGVFPVNEAFVSSAINVSEPIAKREKIARTVARVSAGYMAAPRQYAGSRDALRRFSDEEIIQGERLPRAMRDRKVHAVLRANPDVISRLPELAGKLHKMNKAGRLKGFEPQLRLNADSLFNRLVLEGERVLDVRSILVLSSTPLAVRIAAKGMRRYDSIRSADRRSTAICALLSAADKFNPDLGIKFSTYATWRVRQALVREGGYGDGHAIRLPRQFLLTGEKLDDSRSKEVDNFSAVELLDNCEREGIVSPREAFVLRSRIIEDLTLGKTADALAARFKEPKLSKERIRQIQCEASLKVRRVMWGKNKSTDYFVRKYSK